MIKQTDLFDQFLALYEEGEWTKALRLFIPHPTQAYESLHSSERAFPHFVNYADASVFEGAFEFRCTEQVLETLCKEYKVLQYIADPFLQMIRKEFDLFTFLLAPEQAQSFEQLPPDTQEFFYLLRQGALKNKEKIEKGIESLPPLFQGLFKQKIRGMLGWEIVQQTKPALMEFLGGSQWRYHQPWHPFSYDSSILDLSVSEKGDFPLIFLEPVEDFDYASFLAPYIQKNCLLIFETVHHLFQLLQFPSLHEILHQPHVHLYVLELYPQEQIGLQGIFRQKEKTFFSVRMNADPHLEKRIPVLKEALSFCLQQAEADFFHDTEAANWLYAVAKQIVLEKKSERYGKSRAVALRIERGNQTWHDPHKGALPLQANPAPHQLKTDGALGPLPKDYLEELIKEGMQSRLVRAFAPKNKLRVAHIVPQIVDGGHAPTKLLKTLCSFADQNWFEIIVISTERLVDHLMSYPSTTYHSSSSLQRGALTIKQFNNQGIRVMIFSDSPTYEKGIQDILGYLKVNAFDIAVFHGPDEINSLVASATEVPIRLLFDHGTLPLYPCFDLVLMSTDEAYLQHREEFRQKGMESCLLHFSVDVRQEWEKEPFPREALGLPENSFVMTTISHHLDSRLTNEMCHAVGKILQRCPRAVYAPIGRFTKQDQWKAIFDEYGVNERVFFLGSLPNPSQYARSMNLYLNEFPFGSGLALLDAMAAGCPIVSMYEENGPQQARYAANYFGIDYVVQSGRVEDYVDLACKLIEDRDFYRQWSEHAIEQYEKRVHVQQYVRNFERIIEQFIAYYQKKQIGTS